MWLRVEPETANSALETECGSAREREVAEEGGQKEGVSRSVDILLFSTCSYARRFFAGVSRAFYSPSCELG